MTDTTTITRNSIAEAVYNRTFILDLSTSEKSAFINRFCKCMKDEELTPAKIVHVVSYCERSHDTVIRDFRSETAK